MLYQKKKEYRPSDHISRALREHEKRWCSLIDSEALALTYGIYMWRPYLVGNPFYVLVDHKPLVSLFNHRSRPAPVRITKFRHQVEDISFMVKHIPGKQNPANFMSRHPVLTRGLALEEKNGHMKD